MYHDISTMLQRTEQIWGSEGAVYNERDAVTVSDLSDCLEIDHI